MAGVVERWGHVLLACAIAVPLLVAVIAVRAHAAASPSLGRRIPGLGWGRRIPGLGWGRRIPGLGWTAAAAEVGAVAGTLPWLWMILTPLPQAGAVHPVPLQEVAGYLSVPWDEAVVQLGGNLAVFAAFGALAPLRWRIGLGAVAALAAAGSVTVEAVQYALDLGRVSSVDDVILNTAGAVLAALVTRRWWRFTKRDL